MVPNFFDPVFADIFIELTISVSDNKIQITILIV